MLIMVRKGAPSFISVELVERFRGVGQHQPEIPTPTVLAEGKKSMMNGIKH